MQAPACTLFFFARCPRFAPWFWALTWATLYLNSGAANVVAMRCIAGRVRASFGSAQDRLRPYVIMRFVSGHAFMRAATAQSDIRADPAPQRLCFLSNAAEKLALLYEMSS